MENKKTFNYNWTFKDAVFTKDKGKVFSCFACGGGSTMGYKLSGFDVIGNNDIDKKMIEVYKANHNPKYSFLESITTFAKRKDLPGELYELDILDGSPPCSSFSMAGNREKDWGKEKKFKEGQAEQVLDTLFFDFIDLAKELQPKVVIAENVKGLLLGSAKQYVIKIYEEFEKAGYYCQHFLFDASKMGVPQKRERVFFICLRKDLANKFLHWADMFTELPKIELNFNERVINFGEIKVNKPRKKITKSVLEMYLKRNENEYCLGQTAERLGKRKFFSYMINDNNKPCYTLTASGDNIIVDDGYILDEEIVKCGTFPIDYNFLKLKPNYIVGMSVPPVMVAQIANEVYEQWLSKI
jgi:DNA (cytosine-5)-methyltransferase 1